VIFQSRTVWSNLAAASTVPSGLTANWSMVPVPVTFAAGQGEKRVAGGRIPESQYAVPTAGGKDCTVGAEGD
jgi:hypothetical protein